LQSAKGKEPIRGSEVPGTDEEDEQNEEDYEDNQDEDETVFPGDLQLPIQLSDDDILPPRGEDEVLQAVLDNTAKARNKMMKKCSKNYTIKTFVAGDIVTVKLPRDIRTSTNNKKLFARVLSEPKPNRYELQTEYGVIERLMPTKELEKVPLSLGVTVNGLSKKIALSRAAQGALTSDRVVISCKCKRECNTKRCCCFKEQQKCSIHCHGGDDDNHDCGFLSSLAVRTEKAMSRKRERANTAGDTAGNEVE